MCKWVSGHDNWLDNTFSFELSDKGDNTQLMFTQIYAKELSDEDYGTYNFNWGYYLDSLKASRTDWKPESPTTQTSAPLGNNAWTYLNNFSWAVTVVWPLQP